MPIPLIVPIILGSLAGGGGLAAWAMQDEDEWADADVFNSRMADIHMGVLQLNTLLSECKPIHNGQNKSTLASWRDFVKSWSAYYSSVGKLYLAPNSQTIAEAKRKAAILKQWTDNYIELCGGKLPTGSMSITLPEAPPDKLKEGLTFWEKLSIGVVTGLGLYLVWPRTSRNLKE